VDLIIRQAQLLNHPHLVDIAIKDEKFYRIDKHIHESAKREIDANGRLVTPPFVESHVHLDSALTSGKPRLNESGTLLEGIDIWREYKQNITKEAIKKKAKKAIFWLIANGVLRIRAHTDTTEPYLKIIKAILELKDEMKDFVDIQVVAFPQDGIFSYNGMAHLLEQAIQMGADVVGGIPQVELTREDGIKHIEHIFELAEKYDKLIDIHTDETSDEQSRFVEVIAKYAIKYDMKHLVTASHTTAMHNYNNDYAQKLIGNLKRSEVNIVANPFSNALLQNRLDGYPRRRGITRIDELLEHGINISLGNDNIMDPFNPFGKGSMLQAAHLLVHTAHLNSDQQIGQLFHMITFNGAKTLQDSNYGIVLGNEADCIILNATNIKEAIRLISDCLYVIRKGHIIATTEPAINKLFLNDEEIEVNFK